MISGRAITDRQMDAFNAFVELRVYRVVNDWLYRAVDAYCELSQIQSSRTGGLFQELEMLSIFVLE